MLYLNHKPQSHSEQTREALQAADGYLYLNLPQEALNEIDAVKGDDADIPEVLLARNRVLFHLKRWKDAEQIAFRSSIDHGDREEFLVQRAFALKRMKQSRLAHQVLDEAPEWIRKTGILHYNLACYEAKLGDKASAQEFLDLAFSMNDAMRKNAKHDPDLQSILN